MANNKRVAVFFNPFATNIHSITNQIKALELLNKHNINYHIISNKENVLHNLSEFDECLIIGGDGTINKFINQYKDISIPISVITAGTGNDFARLLLGDKSIKEQFQIFLNGKLIKVNIGNCNDIRFINGVGIGFDGKVVEKMSVGSKYISGKLAYYMHVIPLVFTYKEPQITITIDGKKYIENILMLTVANGKYFGGGFILTPHANFNDNLFDVLTIKKVSLLKRIFNLSKIEKGKHLHLPFVKYNQTSDEILIHSDTELPAHIDGEFYRNKNFKIKFIENTITFKC